MGMLDKVSTTRRMCPVIFVIDTSGSMDGAPIGAVNAALENVLPELVAMNEKNADNEIRVALMTFESNVRWLTSELMLPEDLQDMWQDLNTGVLTSMGAAFNELNNMLSISHGFMQHASGSVAPVLFLLSDGEPTDDYKSGLSKLKNNNWYKVAVRVAIGYGNSNDDVLREFTGNKETVLHTNDPQDLKNMIQFVAITSSQVASTGAGMINTFDDENVDPDNNTQKTADMFGTRGNILNAPTDPGEEF